MREISPLQKERQNYKPKLAGALAAGINNIKLTLGEKTEAVANKEEIKELFPNVYGKEIAKCNIVAEKTVEKNTAFHMIESIYLKWFSLLRV